MQGHMAGTALLGKKEKFSLSLSSWWALTKGFSEVPSLAFITNY